MSSVQRKRNWSRKGAHRADETYIASPGRLAILNSPREHNMTQQEERQVDRGGAAARASEFVAEGRQRLEEFADVQTQFWDKVQESNRKWLDRMQNEATMAADLANKLTSAKSFTETASVFQNWTVKHMEMAADDARRMLSDTQEIMAAGARLWTNAAPGGGEARRRMQ